MLGSLLHRTVPVCYAYRLVNTWSYPPWCYERNPVLHLSSMGTSQKHSGKSALRDQSLTHALLRSLTLDKVSERNEVYVRNSGTVRKGCRFLFDPGKIF